jgi:hypothetical protein
VFIRGDGACIQIYDEDKKSTVSLFYLHFPQATGSIVSNKARADAFLSLNIISTNSAFVPKTQPFLNCFEIHYCEDE